MTAGAFLAYLRELGVDVWADGESLRYSAVKGVLTPTLLADLRKYKLEILTLLGNSASHASLMSQGLKHVSREQPLPLSFAQQRLWLIDQLQPGSSLYNIATGVRFSGKLNLEALERSLAEVIRRHESLRTSFSLLDEQPVQLIAEAVSLSMPLIDLSHLDEAEREAALTRQAEAEAGRGFDLREPPLLRVRMLRLAQDEHVLLLTMHHIISDGWSMGVLVREVGALYEAYERGEESPLEELEVQYVDYAVWQRERLKGEELERELGYWREQLRGAPAVLELPTDRVRPAVQTYRGGRQSVRVTSEVVSRLREVGQSEGATLYMVLLGAFSVLLWRYSGAEDVVVGTPVANRTRGEVEGLIGFFVNTLVMRVEVRGEESYRELVRRVREVSVGGYGHQEVPFEKVVEELTPERSLSHTPLFQVMFNFRNVPSTDVNLSGLKLSSLRAAEREAKFPLTLYVNEHGSEFTLEVVYQRALFSAARMSFLLEQLRYLLEQIVDDPDLPISLHSLVTPETCSLLPDLKEAIPEPRYESVSEMFLLWARQTPSAPAVYQRGQACSYGELSEAARSVAQALISQGVERGDVVAVLGERSIGLVAGMLGVFMSGAVLLTIDRALPAKRQELLVKEAGAKCLLYISDEPREQQWFQEQLPVVIYAEPSLKRLLEAQRESVKEFRLPELAPTDPAYMFFTSGTTGIPKGVLGCHRGLGHFLTWQRATFEIKPSDRCAQLTALSFDVVLRDVFLPLVSGATLCLPDEDGELGADKVMAWMEREKITILHTVPSLAQSWLAEPYHGFSPSTLRWVFFAGEPLTDKLVRRWSETFSRACGIVNLYGPTETTLAKCFYIVPPESLVASIQPIGWPLPQTQVLVLNETGRLCGISEPGQIVVRTPFRTLGYVNASAEDEARFVRNPFRDEESDMLYYTGDRGRYRPDGSLEILGRMDHQVKIRGVRVQPDEVASILSEHRDVETCVVIDWKGEDGQTGLAAYVVLKKESVLSNAELRNYLSAYLPSVMIPSIFTFIERLPLTPNGKVERTALPPLDLSQLRRANYVAPRNPVEQALARIWADVLKLERISIYDNFFELGGHSLLATQALSRVRRHFDMELPLQGLFKSPTIAGLSELIAQCQTNESKSQQPRLRRVAREPYRMELSQDGSLKDPEISKGF